MVSQRRDRGSDDHKAKDPVENGNVLTPDASIIIVEGNYLLLDEPGWWDLVSLVDYRLPSHCR